MTKSQQDLVDAIAELDLEISLTRKKLNEIQKDLNNTESDLISAKLKKEELIDQLRRMKAEDINQPLTYREMDIAAFREKLPTILASLEEKDKK